MAGFELVWYTWFTVVVQGHNSMIASINVALDCRCDCDSHK